jgi:hypothetical protein
LSFLGTAHLFRSAGFSRLSFCCSFFCPPLLFLPADAVGQNVANFKYLFYVKKMKNIEETRS